MDRERITISIKKDLLEKIDKQIDGLRMRNRSHAIELLVSGALGVSTVNEAVIMAGGKSAVKLIPTVISSIKKLRAGSVKKIYIATGFLGEKIKQGISGIDNSDIEYIEGSEGTAGALNLLQHKIKRTFLIINSDEELNIDIHKMLDFHNLHEAKITAAVKNQDNMKGYYLVEPSLFGLIKGGFSMLEEDIFPQLIKENELLIYPMVS